nr:hypothetical protein [Tanacetum cinerariifolium]
MASFDYRLNPLYPIKECSSYGALYTTDYCCSDGSLRDKIICDLDKTPDLSPQPPQNYPKCGHPVDGQYCQGYALIRKKFKEDLFTYCVENGILQDAFEPSNDNTNVVNALQEPFVVNQDPGKNSSQSLPQINHYCCYGCGDPLVDIFSINVLQTIDEIPPTLPSFDSACYSEDGNSFTYDSKSNLVYDSSNVSDPPPQPPLYSCEFCENDTHYGHYCTPQVSFIYPEPCYNQDFNFPQDFHDFQQQYLCCENCGDPHEACQCQPMNKYYYHDQNSCYDPNSFGFDQFQPPQYTEEEKQIEEEQAARYWKIPACYDDDDDDDDYTIAITPKEPDNSLMSPRVNMSVTCLLVKFLRLSPLFDADYDFSSVENQSFSDEYIPKKIYSNPLFDEEIISMKIDPHHSNAESDLIESLLNHDSLIISSSSKIDSLFDEFAGELTLLKSIPPGSNETDCDPKEETHFIKRLLYDNSYPRPPKEFISKNSNAAFKYFFASPIPVEDSDSLKEKIDLSFTLDYPMPPGIEEYDYDSESDILILEEFLSNDSLSLPENASFHFDIPSSSRPPAKPPDGNSGILNVKVTGGISEHKVPMPRLMFTQSTLVPNQEKSPNLLPHLGHKAFQPTTECPMMIYGKNTPILDVPFFHFYPLDQFMYGGIGSS